MTTRIFNFYGGTIGECGGEPIFNGERGNLEREKWERKWPEGSLKIIQSAVWQDKEEDPPRVIRWFNLVPDDVQNLIVWLDGWMERHGGGGVKEDPRLTIAARTIEEQKAEILRLRLLFQDRPSVPTLTPQAGRYPPLLSPSSPVGNRRRR